jgi:hypothetical protein
MSLENSSILSGTHQVLQSAYLLIRIRQMLFTFGMKCLWKPVIHQYTCNNIHSLLDILCMNVGMDTCILQFSTLVELDVADEWFVRLHYIE